MKRFLISAAATLVVCITSYAQQNAMSAYFLDGYTYSYKFNPAFTSQWNYFTMPALGQTALGLSSNLGVSDLVYKKPDGQLATFLHKDIPAEQALSGFKDINRIGCGINETIFGFGIRSGKTYSTIDLSVRADAAATLPGDLMRFAKTGAADGHTEFDLKALGCSVNSHLELAYGLGIDTKAVSFGFRLKMLVGLAQASAGFDRLQLRADASQWSVNSAGNMEMCLPYGFDLQTKGETGTAEEPEDEDVIDFQEGFMMPENSGSVLKKPSLGAALDLGVSVRFAEYFKISASILDLGAIRWTNRISARTPDGEWTYEGFNDISAGAGSEDNVDEQFKQIGDELADLANFHKQEGIQKARFEMVPFTANASLEVTMPFWKPMSVGAVGYCRYWNGMTFYEARAALNFSFGNCFSMSGSCGYGSYGLSTGAALDLHVRGLNFFLVADNLLMLSRLSSQYIPLSRLGACNLSLGINFIVGKAKRPLKS